MSSQNNGIGNYPESDAETEGGMLDLFSPLKKYDLITSGKSTEIRLFTVLERYVYTKNTAWNKINKILSVGIE